jgi:aminoglycoside phosphotransferase (APT) family kinase protein
VADDALQLPDDIVPWIEELTGARVLATNRVPGGASREAWFVDAERPDGAPWPLFLRFSREKRPSGGLFHDLRVEAEVFLALNDTEVTVPRTLGVHPTREAMLAERVSGGTWFYRIKDADEQVRVAQDFIRNLAALHRIDPATLDIPSLGPIRSARELALAEIANMRRRATGPDGAMDPLVRVSLEWLERNVPAYDGPVVLVQGDTGPGNFMYEDGRVTAVVDWELAHWGDPMDDIAWLSLRTVQDTFTHFPDRIREYEELSGNEVDEARVWYYRLFAETRLSSNGFGGGRPQVPDGPVNYDVGNGLIYSMLHRRLSLEALARVMGLDLVGTELPEPPPPEEWHALYDLLLGNFQAIVPRVADPLANAWSKGAVRLVKHLKELDRSGRAFAEAELDDIAALLGTRPLSVAEGRAAVARANADGKVSDEDYVRYAWRRVQRDDELLRPASGALATRTWPDLSD